MALRNDWDDLNGAVDWEDSEIDSGYFNSDDEAGNPMDSWTCYIIIFSACTSPLLKTNV